MGNLSVGFRHVLEVVQQAAASLITTLKNHVVFVSRDAACALESAAVDWVWWSCDLGELGELLVAIRDQCSSAPAWKMHTE